MAGLKPFFSESLTPLSRLCFETFEAFVQVSLKGQIESGASRQDLSASALVESSSAALGTSSPWSLVHWQWTVSVQQLPACYAKRSLFCHFRPRQ